MNAQAVLYLDGAAAHFHRFDAVIGLKEKNFSLRGQFAAGEPRAQREGHRPFSAMKLKRAGQREAPTIALALELRHPCRTKDILGEPAVAKTLSPRLVV